MAKRRKYRRRKNYNYEPLELNLHPEAKKAIFVIILLALGALGTLSFFKVAGQFGEILDNALAVVFGSLRLVFSISMVVLAGLVYLGRGVKILTYVGLLLFFCSLNGLVHLIAYHDVDLIVASQLGQGGGYVGLCLSYPLLQFVGFAGAVLITLALLLISLIIIFNTSLGTVLKIIKISTQFFYKLFKNLYYLIRSATDKDFSPFTKRQVYDDEGNEDDEGDEEKENEEFEPTKEISPMSANRQKAPVTMLLKKRRVRIDIPLSLLSRKTGKANAGDIKNRTSVIQKTLANFGIEADMGPLSIGPTVTQYTLKPADGVRLQKISSLSDNLALALAAHPVRIEAPIPGQSLVGIEVPNKNIAVVNLRDVLSSKEFRARKTNLSFVLGKDVAGKNWIGDLTKMPHLLVAGSTNSGKSICLHSIILSLLFSNGPDDVNLILIDAKRVELPVYNGIPHLLTPVITDIKQTVNSLKWAISEMERRLDILAKAGRRDIQSFNSAMRNKMPYIVIVIDELADLVASAGAEIEGCIVRLAQKARASGIHLILSTQRPSVDVVTGLIKANFPARIAFSVRSINDSRTMIDGKGAEKLLGRGDMLFITSEISKPKRLQGAFVEEQDIKKIVKFIKENYGKAEYNNEVVEKQKIQVGGGMSIDTESNDPLLEDAIEKIMSAEKASASLLQRHLKVGYARAARILDTLEEQGMIGPADGAKPREILIKKEDLQVAQTPLHDPEEYNNDQEEDDDDYDEEESYNEEDDSDENSDEDDDSDDDIDDDINDVFEVDDDDEEYEEEDEDEEK